MFNFLKRRKAPDVLAIASPKPKVNAGIVFGAGGTRGLAHIGVIRAFEENHISFSCVSGCSAGSIAAALYAYGYNSYEMEREISKIRIKDIKNGLLFLPSNSRNIERLVERFIGETKFEQLSIPLALVAVDLISAEEIVLNFGKISTACAASSAVPALFTPVELNEYRLIDGGLTNPIPADVLRVMGADVVISVDINAARGIGTDSLGWKEGLLAAFRIGMRASAEKGIFNSDIVLSPDTFRFNRTKLDDIEGLIAEGYRVTMAHMDEIKKLLKITT